MSQDTFEPRIIGFLCNWCSYRAADLAGTARIKHETARLYPLDNPYRYTVPRGAWCGGYCARRVCVLWRLCDLGYRCGPGRVWGAEVPKQCRPSRRKTSDFFRFHNLLCGLD